VSQFVAYVQLSSTLMSPALVVATDRYREHPQQIVPPAWSTTTGCGAVGDGGDGVELAGEEPPPQDGPASERVNGIQSKRPGPRDCMAPDRSRRLLPAPEPFVSIVR
jgi:hypothetical protein